ncbi:MAG: hypothetical protein HWD59_09515 [Coxiellaceae bacterium]|nr:MAG: hypothetical protein HWD59_09515 [Coxiellaceae bacterium]
MPHKTKITYPKIAAYAFDYPVYSGKHSFSPVDFVEDGFIDIKSNNDQNYFVDTYITGVDYYSVKSSDYVLFRNYNPYGKGGINF